MAADNGEAISIKITKKENVFKAKLHIFLVLCL